MTAVEVLRAFFGAGKLSTVDVSLKMGRNRSFLSAYLTRGNEPKVGLFAEILDVIGYDLLMRKRDDGTEIILDPRPKEGDE